MMVKEVQKNEENTNHSKEKVANSAPHNCHMKRLHIWPKKKLNETIKTKTK